MSSKTSIWVARRDGKMAYVLHPSWCLSTSRKLRTMCLTDGCTHVCALSGLQQHVKAAHYKGNYNLRELKVIDVSCHGKVGGNEDSEESVASNNSTGDKDDHEGEEDPVAPEENVEEGKEEERASEINDGHQITTLLSSKRRIAAEDFEDYQPRGAPQMSLLVESRMIRGA